MNNFKDFDIKTEQTGFTGEKIKVNKVLNKQIVVRQFKIEPSKFDGMRLTLQIEVDGEQRVVFTSSKGLSEQIQKVPKDKFPFTATIVENNERFEFT